MGFKGGRVKGQAVFLRLHSADDAHSGLMFAIEKVVGEFHRAVFLFIHIPDEGGEQLNRVIHLLDICLNLGRLVLGVFVLVGQLPGETAAILLGLEELLGQHFRQLSGLTAFQ